MKRLLGATMLAALLALPATLMAQDGGRQGRREGPRAGARPGGDRQGGGQWAVIGQLNLTEEQRPKVREALGKVTEASKDDVAKEQELAKQLQAAQEAKDEAKIKELTEQRNELKKARDTKVAEALKPILTAEQYEKLIKLQAEAPRRPGMGGPGAGGPMGMLIERAKEFDLSEEQVKKIQDITRQAMESMRDLRDDRDARRQAMEKLQTDINAVLTPAQQEKVKAARAEMAQNMLKGMVAGRTRDLGLSADQQKQVDDLVKAAGESAKAATTEEARRQVNTKLMTDVKAILTPEQQTKWDKAQEEMRARFNRGGQQGGRQGGREGGRDGARPAPARD